MLGRIHQVPYIRENIDIQPFGYKHWRNSEESMRHVQSLELRCRLLRVDYFLSPLLPSVGVDGDEFPLVPEGILPNKRRHLHPNSEPNPAAVVVLPMQSPLRLRCLS